MSKKALGLIVDKDGCVTLAGKPFYGMGVNWHGGFACGTLPKQFGREGFNIDEYIAPLSENGIPFMRVMLGVFYANEVDNYLKTPDKFFTAMDEFIAASDKYKVGIIPSLMWNLSTFMEYYGEPVSEIGNKNSKGVKLAVRYVTDVVKRYKDSPAIWGWEIGNEGNLGADIGWIKESHPQFSTNELNSYYKTIADAIRAADSDRLIVAGDSEPRGSSKSLRTKQSWEPYDTYEDTMETVGLYTPAPLDCFSIHLYQYDKEILRDFKSVLEKFIRITKELKVGLFVGEFGPDAFGFHNLLDEIGPGDPREQKERTCFYAIWNAIMDTDTQLSAAWCYRRDEQPSDGTSITPGGQNAYQWDSVVRANQRYAKEGKAFIKEYWESVK